MSSLDAIYHQKPPPTSESLNSSLTLLASALARLKRLGL